ncbi:unnamed protein product [Aphanomyces euteiches]
MAHPSTLEKSVFALKQVREAATEALQKTLASLEVGDVELVVESSLLRLFRHAVNLEDVQVRTIYALETHQTSSFQRNGAKIVYIVRPQVARVHLVTKHIQEHAIPLPECVVLHTGSWNALCADVFTRFDTEKRIKLVPLALGFVPLDHDILTLGHESLLRDCYLHGDKTGLTEIAHALHLLQQTIGEIPSIHYKGELSKSVWKALAELNAKEPPPPKQKKQRLDGLILLDRKLDNIAPLSTPLTHEGLMAELLDFQNGVVKVDPKIANIVDAKPTTPMVEWSFNSDDEIFQDIRDKHVQAIGPYLHSTSAVFSEERKQIEATLKSDSTSVKDLDALSISMTQHVDKCAILWQHIALAELIQVTTKSKTFKSQWLLEKSILERQNHLGDIEALIWKQTPACTVLRLLCLHSLANQGIPKAAYSHLKSQCLNLYGLEYLHVFENLEMMGILTPAAATNGLGAVNQIDAWHLTGHFDCDPCNPDDPSYVSGGYCPLTVKLVEAALSDEGWKPLEALLNRLPGPSAVLSAPVKPKKTKKVLVVVVGGITPLEMAALRFVGKKNKCSFLFAGDAVLSGKAFLNQAMERIPNGLLL